MKKMLLALSAVSAISFGSVAAAAAAVGTPEVDAANATMQLAPSTFRATSCAGEDGTKYETFRGAWKGNEVAPPGTDYNLNGTLTVARVVWTINLSTDRGILTGVATLDSPNSAGGLSITYSGPITLITQGLPNTTGNGAQARGWINARTYMNSVADGGSLLANVELMIAPGFGVNGEFGNTMGFNDFSVAFNNMTC